MVDPFDDPDVAVPGADCGAAALGQEIEAREPKLAEPRVGLGNGQNVNREGSIRAADSGPSRQPFGPARRTSSRKKRERLWRRRLA